MVKLQCRFYPTWMHANYGLTYGERYARDPAYRVEQDMQQQRFIAERLGDVDLGSTDPKPDPNLSAVWKNIVSIMYGAQPHYAEHDDGWLTPADVTLQQIAALEAPTIEGNPYVDELTRQARWFTDRYGPVVLNPGIDGILNCAVNVCGEQFLTWLIDEPDTAVHMLKLLRQTTVELHEHFRQMCGEPAAMGLGNCTLCMISPNTYEELIKPLDMIWCRRAQSFDLPFGFHMDGKIDIYLEMISRFDYLHRVDMGSDSDIALARRHLPGRIIRVYLYPHMLQPMSLPQVKQLLDDMIDASGPDDDIIFQLDVSAGMSEQLVRTVAQHIDHRGGPVLQVGRRGHG